jgi:hypothetical protein
MRKWTTTGILVGAVVSGAPGQVQLGLKVQF